MKQQSADIHITPLGHIILIPSQPVLTLECCMLSGEATNTNYIVFGSNPRYTTLEASTLNIESDVKHHNYNLLLFNAIGFCYYVYLYY